MANSNQYRIGETCTVTGRRYSWAEDRFVETSETGRVVGLEIVRTPTGEKLLVTLLDEGQSLLKARRIETDF